MALNCSYENLKFVILENLTWKITFAELLFPLNGFLTRVTVRTISDSSFKARLKMFYCEHFFFGESSAAHSRLLIITVMWGKLFSLPYLFQLWLFSAALLLRLGFFQINVQQTRALSWSNWFSFESVVSWSFFIARFHAVHKKTVLLFKAGVRLVGGFQPQHNNLRLLLSGRKMTVCSSYPEWRGQNGVINYCSTGFPMWLRN